MPFELMGGRKLVFFLWISGSLSNKEEGYSSRLRAAGATGGAGGGGPAGGMPLLPSDGS